MGTSIEDTSDRSERLLTSRVPDVHLDELCGLETALMRVTLSKLHRLDLEVPGESRLCTVLVEHVADVSLDQTGLTNHGFTDADDLVVFLLHASLFVGIDDVW